MSAHEASRWYRARKFVGRNRLLVGGVAATMLALAVGLGATLWQARKVRTEARRAEAVQGFLVSVFTQADPDQAKGKDLTAREILDKGSARIDSEFAAQPDVRTVLWGVIHDLNQKLGDYKGGAAAARGQVERGPDGATDPRRSSTAWPCAASASALLETEDA